LESAAGAGEVTTTSEATARRLQCLLQVARDVNSSLDLRDVLDRIVRQATSILEAESGSIMLREDDEAHLKVVAARGPRARRIMGRVQRTDEGVAGWVVRHGEPLLLRGAATDPRFTAVGRRPDVRDALCVPLRLEERVLGAVSVSNRRSAEPFNQDDLELLAALGNQVSVAVRNAETHAEAQRQRQTVERLLREVAGAQVEERNRIALQLHDGPAQTMYAALRNLQAVQALATELPAGVPAILDELERTIRSSIDETRAVMLDLRPPALDDWGLDTALRQYAQQFETRTGIRTQVVRRGLDLRLPSAMESCLYRIAQEALTNVWKHAEATHARVLLDVGRRRCVLQVRDDGRGFEPAGARSDEKLGLASLRDRAQLVGGRLQIESPPGKGTTVSVTAPLWEQGAPA
jgi:signal transduction histidine kinase